MSLPPRRSLAEIRIALGSFDRFLLLYGAMFAAFGVASPFLPALLHVRGLGPSEIGAVLAAGTAVRLITGPVAQAHLIVGEVSTGLRYRGPQGRLQRSLS
jgi:hypothetical protein